MPARGYNAYHHPLDSINGHNGCPTSSIRAFDENEAAEFDLPQPEAIPDEKSAKLAKIADLADSLAWVLRYCWTGQANRMRDARAAFRRFVAISMTVRPDLFPDVSYEKMARQLRLTKGGLSYLSLDFSDKAGLHFRRSRRESVREKFAEAQRKAWKRRRKI